MRTIQARAFAAMALLFLLFLAASIYFGRIERAFLVFIPLILWAGWNEPRFIFYLLVISLPFSTEVFFENGLSTDFPDEGLMWLMSLVVLCVLVYKKPPGLNQRLRHPLSILLWIWLGWIAVSVALSTNPLISLKYFAAKLWYVGALFVPVLIFTGYSGGDGKFERRQGGFENFPSSRLPVSSAENFPMRFLQVLVTAMIIVMLIIVYRHWQLDLGFTGINEAVRPFFRNHVNYSAMLVCLLPVLLLTITFTPRGPGRYLLVILGLLVLTALFFAYARGAWLALLTGLVAGFLIKKRRIVSAYVIIMALLVAAVFWLKNEDRYLEYAPHYQTTVFHENFREHLAATYRLRDISTVERFNRWIAGINMVAERPVTGFGPNSFYPEYKAYMIPAFKTWVSDNPEKSGVHNYFLLLAVEQGLPGMFFFMLLTGFMLYYSQRIFQNGLNKLQRYIALCAGVITVMMVTLNLLSDLVETDKIGSLFFISLGILVCLDRKKAEGSSDPGPHMQGIP